MVISKIILTRSVPMTVAFYPEDFETIKEWNDFVAKAQTDNQFAEDHWYDNIIDDEVKDIIRDLDPGINSLTVETEEIDDNVSTQDAIVQMIVSGKRIRHRTFGDEEWMRYQKGEPSYFVFEDDVKVSPEDFWKDRTGEGWQDGWTILD